MTNNEAKQVLNALLSLDPDLRFEDWENGDGEEIEHLLREAAEIIKREIGKSQ